MSEMSTTIRISAETEAYIKYFGKFGETHDDVLKRTLDRYGKIEKIEAKVYPDNVIMFGVWSDTSNAYEHLCAFRYKSEDDLNHSRFVTRLKEEGHLKDVPIGHIQTTIVPCPDGCKYLVEARSYIKWSLQYKGKEIWSAIQESPPTNEALLHYAQQKGVFVTCVNREHLDGTTKKHGHHGESSLILESDPGLFLLSTRKDYIYVNACAMRFSTSPGKTKKMTEESVMRYFIKENPSAIYEGFKSRHKDDGIAFRWLDDPKSNHD